MLTPPRPFLGNRHWATPRPAAESGEEMHSPRTGEFDPAARVDLGSPGASARAEFERRRRIDDRRRRKMFGRFLAPIVKVVAGERRSTIAWGTGGRGELRVGTYLSRAVGGTGVLLHDRRVPGTRSNIDHIAVVPSGVWVIDTKQYTGRVQRRDLGGWFTSRPALFVNGRNRTQLVPAVQHQGALVQRAAGAALPVRVALCFTGAEWGMPGRPFRIDGVSVTRPRRLAAALRRPGPLDRGAIAELATRIAAAFPSYRSGPSE
jgi:Nuclease-related domain